jgi:hypothetical protein
LTPAVHGQSSSYCIIGTQAVAVSTVSDVRSKCKPGDTLILSGAETGAVAMLCDLSRTVVLPKGDVVCVLVEERATR